MKLLIIKLIYLLFEVLYLITNVYEKFLSTIFNPVFASKGRSDYLLNNSQRKVKVTHELNNKRIFQTSFPIFLFQIKFVIGGQIPFHLKSQKHLIG